MIRRTNDAEWNSDGCLPDLETWLDLGRKCCLRHLEILRVQLLSAAKKHRFAVWNHRNCCRSERGTAQSNKMAIFNDRSTATQRVFFSFLLLSTLTTHAFQSQLAHRPYSPIASSTLSATPLIDTIGTSFHDFIYQAEASANALASTSLSDTASMATALPILYGAGLLTSLSPCVWGLLPLTLSYISTAAGEREDQQALWPTVAFAAGLAAVFCTLGVVATQVGGLFFGSSMVGGILSSGICFVMGLTILELVQIPLPSVNSLQDRVLAPANGNMAEEPILLDATGQILPPKGASSSDNNGSLFRTFLLGGSSALVSSPCATPVLTSILAFVAKASNPVYGALLLFGYTLGYATPLLIVAGTGGQALARSSSIGPWVTPITGCILLLYGTNGLLTAVFGDPSIAALTIN